MSFTSGMPPWGAGAGSWMARVANVASETMTGLMRCVSGKGAGSLPTAAARGTAVPGLSRFLAQHHGDLFGGPRVAGRRHVAREELRVEARVRLGERHEPRGE